MKVSRIVKDSARHPTLDLTAVQETIAYMHGDMARLPGLERVAGALERALAEIDSVQQNPPPGVRIKASLKSIEKIPCAARFLPRAGR